MNTHSTTNNHAPISANTDLLDNTQPPVFDEAMLSQMANAFFASWPGAASTDQALPTALQSADHPTAPPHLPQTAEPISALSSRVPNIAYEKSIHPDYPEHIPNYPDYPERRMLSSAPVIGGANLPRPPYEAKFPQLRDDLARGQQPSKVQSGLSATEMAPFYFLDFQSARPETQIDLSRIDHAQTDVNLAQLDDADLTQLLSENRFTAAETSTASASPFYFLDPTNIPTQDAASSGGKQQAVANTPPRFHTEAAQALDVEQIRRDFPILQEQVNGHPLIWFDNAATTQKPQSVIDRIRYFYQHENSNIHRAAHELAARSTDAFEHARQTVARFIGAESANEIVFVRGTTEAINLVAKTWGVQNIGSGDEILISQLEHHANIVPWYQLSQQTGAKLRVIPVDDQGQIIMQQVPNLLTDRTKLIAITQVSNALGTITPTAEIIELAHAKGIRVLVDAAQSVAHLPSNVRALDADFFVFSGHKIFAPTGIGVLYAKPELLESMPVWEGGGNMIQDVSFEHVSYQAAPNKFEAGTANIADAVGLAAALEYLDGLGLSNIARYEHDLLEYGQYGLQSVPGLRLIGTAPSKASVMSFTLNGYRTEQVGKALNEHGIAVRSGHHCAQPILRRFGLESTVRPSLAFYNTTAEIDKMVAVLHQLVRKPSYI